MYIWLYVCSAIKDTITQCSKVFIAIRLPTSSVWGPSFPHMPLNHSLSPWPHLTLGLSQAPGPGAHCSFPVLPLLGASVKVFLFPGSAVGSFQPWSWGHILKPLWVSGLRPGHLDLAQPGCLSHPRDFVGGWGTQASWPTSWGNRPMAEAFCWALGVFDKPGVGPALAQFTE